MKLLQPIILIILISNPFFKHAKKIFTIFVFEKDNTRTVFTTFSAELDQKRPCSIANTRQGVTYPYERHRKFIE